MHTVVIRRMTSVAVVAGLLSQGVIPQPKAQRWLTTPDRTSLFKQDKHTLHFASAEATGTIIEVDDAKKYQPIDGFGFALTGGSAQLLMQMDKAKRTKLLHELFDTKTGAIGISYLRVSVGSSDMNDHAFTYDDLPAGGSDQSLAKFDFGPDKTSVIPVLKEILAIAPSIEILGSPWSAPAWMKTNESLIGGSLKREEFTTYAHYFVKYLQGMQAEGIRIDAITPQNEPLHPKNNPSMYMTAEDQRDFIKSALGPELRKAGLKTKIIVYDHNCDKPEYATTVLSDPEAAQYVDGSGFHLYKGTIDAMTTVHDADPKKNLYFTEQMTVQADNSAPLHISKPVAGLIVAAPRNWSRNVLLWNLAADSHDGPHTDKGGCPMCQGAITIDGNQVTRNIAYYTVAHASRFVRPGSVRIESTSTDTLPSVGFTAPGGKTVLIVTNTSDAEQVFHIRSHGKSAGSTLAAGAAATYVW